MWPKIKREKGCIITDGECIVTFSLYGLKETKILKKENTYEDCFTLGNKNICVSFVNGILKNYTIF